MISEQSTFAICDQYKSRRVYGSKLQQINHLKPLNTKQPFNRKRIIQKQQLRSIDYSRKQPTQRYRINTEKYCEEDTDNPQVNDSRKRFFKSPSQYAKIQYSQNHQYLKNSNQLSRNKGYEDGERISKVGNRENIRHGQKDSWNIMENNFKQHQNGILNQKKSTDDILKRIKQCLSPTNIHAETSMFISKDQTVSSKLSSYQQSSTKASAKIKSPSSEEWEDERWRSNTNVFNNLKFLKHKSDVQLMNQQSQRKRSIELQRNASPSSKILSKFLSQSNLVQYKKSEVSDKKPVSIQDFKLIKIVGQGRYGVVYQAIHKQLGCVFALKKISKSKIKQHSIQKQLLHQIKYQSFIQHPNITRMFGCFSDSQNLYLILEYMEQGTLYDLLRKQSKVLPQNQSSKIVGDMVIAVNYLQDMNVAHRDIKPENIVRSYGVNKLCDFGWIVSCKKRRRTYCGTIGYVAPEILEGKEYNESVDLWGLGVLVCELVTGKIPFESKDKNKIGCQNIVYSKSTSTEAKSFIECLIKKDPDQRVKLSNLLKHPFLMNA